MENNNLLPNETKSYDILGEEGITPSSEMKEIKDLSLKMLRTNEPEKLNALEQLRFVKNRLFIDFFLFYENSTPIIPADLKPDPQNLIDDFDLKDIDGFLFGLGWNMQQMEKDFKTIELPDISLEYDEDLFDDEPCGLDDIIQFDT